MFQHARAIVQLQSLDPRSIDRSSFGGMTVMLKRLGSDRSAVSSMLMLIYRLHTNKMKGSLSRSLVCMLRPED